MGVLAQSSEVSASPTVADGAVYVGDWEGYMYAADAEDGSERWTLDVTDEARATRGDGERVRSSPTVADGLVFVFSDDGYLYAIDTERGDVDWRFDTETPIGLMQHAPSPTVVDGIVYFERYDGVRHRCGYCWLGCGIADAVRNTRSPRHLAETAAAADRPSLEEIHQPRDVGGGSETTMARPTTQTARTTAQLGPVRTTACPVSASPARSRASVECRICWPDVGRRRASDERATDAASTADPLRSRRRHWTGRMYERRRE
ncbi:hypothetical protein D8S78_03330 [Natrialba swarupiae]|nr:hypothetical protein [Natrialba swarupiae]